MNKNLKNQARPIIEEFVQEITKSRIEISNNKPIPFRDDKVRNYTRKAYKVPIDFLRFRKDNGRIASDVMTWENSKGTLDELTEFSQTTLKRFLELKDPEPTEELMNSLFKDGQEDKAVITVDGFLINGNRRKMALEKLLDKYPGDERFKYLEVVILPGNNEKEPATTLLDIEQLENRLQYQRKGIADYYNFDKALSVKRKIELGMSLEEQLLDDANFYTLKGKDLKKKIREFEEDYLKPLQCIDKYLDFMKRPGHYNTISEGRGDSEGRWQAFLDYYKLVFKKLNDDKQRIKLGIQEDEVGRIENVAFKIIRKRELTGLNKKAHQIMRDLPKLISNSGAKKELFELNKINFELPIDETTDEEGKQIDEKTKDIMWGNKYAKDVIWHVKKAYEIFEQKKEKDTPIELLNAAIDKLNHSNMDINSIDLDRLDEAMKLTREIQIRANEIEHLLYDFKKNKNKLKDKFKKN